MVIDANTGKVLYDRAGDARRYPASLTKMMTLYLTFELIEKGRLSYSDDIPVSAQASAQPPSKLDLKAGEKISVRDAVRALVTKSANDVAVALAERIGGSEQNFARLMTRKARELGMSRTTFRNASGLPNDEQVTTARDMLTLALHLQDDFPEHYRVFATKQFSYGGESYRNHNTLLYHYRGTDGIKTGYTRASGFNLVASVHREGRHLIAAVFGGKSAGSRNSEMRSILDRAFSKASTKRTRRSTPELTAKPRTVKRTRQAAAKEAPMPEPPLPRQAPDAAPEPPPPAALAAIPPAVPPKAEPPVQFELARVRTVAISDHLDDAETASASAPAPGSTATAAVTLPASEPAQADGVRNAAVALPANPAGSQGVVLGRAPSTLHEQLSRILAAHRDSVGSVEANPESVRARLRDSVNDLPQAAAAARGPYQVQIGAYRTPDEAERQLQRVREEAARLLAGASTLTEPVVVGGNRRLYRARFAGFDSSSATHTCLELRRRSIDCLVTRER